MIKPTDTTRIAFTMDNALNILNKATKKLNPTNQLEFLRDILPKGKQGKSVNCDRDIILFDYEVKRQKHNKQRVENLDLFTFICVHEGNTELNVIYFLRNKVLTFKRGDYYRLKGNYNNNKKVTR